MWGYGNVPKNRTLEIVVTIDIRRISVLREALASTSVGGCQILTASRGKDSVRRLRTLVLLLRYSGMRIGDVVRLTRDKINGNKLFLYTQKSGTPVYAVLPDFVIAASDRHTFFLEWNWSVGLRRWKLTETSPKAISTR
jgi:integrase